MKLEHWHYSYAADALHEALTKAVPTPIAWDALEPKVYQFGYFGPLVAKERPRTTKSGKMYTAAKTRAFERDVAIAAKGYMSGEKPLPYPLRLDLLLYDGTDKPGEVALGLSNVAHYRKNDIDNIAKAILDGCNKILWHDDKQIVDLRVRRRYSKRSGFIIKLQRAGMTDNELTTLKGVYRRRYGKDPY